MCYIIPVRRWFWNCKYIESSENYLKTVAKSMFQACLWNTPNIESRKNCFANNAVRCLCLFTNFEIQYFVFQHMTVFRYAKIFSFCHYLIDRFTFSSLFFSIILLRKIFWCFAFVSSMIKTCGQKIPHKRTKNEFIKEWSKRRTATAVVITQRLAQALMRSFRQKVGNTSRTQRNM